MPTIQLHPGDALAQSHTIIRDLSDDLDKAMHMHEIFSNILVEGSSDDSYFKETTGELGLLSKKLLDACERYRIADLQINQAYEFALATGNQLLQDMIKIKRNARVARARCTAKRELTAKP